MNAWSVKTNCGLKMILQIFVIARMDIMKAIMLHVNYATTDVIHVKQSFYVQVVFSNSNVVLILIVSVETVFLKMINLNVKVFLLKDIECDSGCSICSNKKMCTECDKSAHRILN